MTREEALGLKLMKSRSELWIREKLPRLVDSSAECVRV